MSYTTAYYAQQGTGEIPAHDPLETSYDTGKIASIVR